MRLERVGLYLTSALLLVACGGNPGQAEARSHASDNEIVPVSQNYTKLTLVFDGENYYSLASACGGSPQDLVAFNGNKDLHAGGNVLVPDTSRCLSVDEIRTKMNQECTLQTVQPRIDDTVYSLSSQYSSVPAFTSLASGFTDARAIVQGQNVVVAPGCDIRREQ